MVKNWEGFGRCADLSITRNGFPRGFPLISTINFTKNCEFTQCHTTLPEHSGLNIICPFVWRTIVKVHAFAGGRTALRRRFAPEEEIYSIHLIDRRLGPTACLNLVAHGNIPVPEVSGILVLQSTANHRNAKAFCFCLLLQYSSITLYTLKTNTRKVTHLFVRPIFNFVICLSDYVEFFKKL